MLQASHPHSLSSWWHPDTEPKHRDQSIQCCQSNHGLLGPGMLSPDRLAKQSKASPNQRTDPTARVSNLKGAGPLVAWADHRHHQASDSFKHFELSLQSPLHQSLRLLARHRSSAEYPSDSGTYLRQSCFTPKKQYSVQQRVSHLER